MQTPTLQASRRTKKTPVGELPVEWAVVRFGDVVADSQYGLSNASSPDGRIPMLGMKNIDDGKLVLGDLARVDISEAELGIYRLQDGDLLFNRTNSPALVGKAALFSEAGDYVCASYLVKFRLRKDRVDPRFVCYVLNTSHSRRTLQELATKAVAQANINPTVLQKMFWLPLPSLREQKAVANILAVWDDAIEKQDSLIAAERERKRGLMQQLLSGRVRFREFVKSADRVKTRYGSFPADWAAVHIGDIADEVSEKNGSGHALPVLSCTKYRGLVNSLEYFGKPVFSADTSNYKVVRRGDFAYATNHVEEGSIGYQNLHDTALISPMYTVFRTREGVDHSFFFRLVKTELYRHIFEVNTSGSIARRGGLRWEEFALIKVFLPSVPEQKRIAEVLSTCDRKIELLERQLAALKEQKRGLMQKLLTGEVRVKV
jgi:type I restriction enzyme, S subunit